MTNQLTIDDDEVIDIAQESENSPFRSSNFLTKKFSQNSAAVAHLPIGSKNSIFQTLQKSFLTCKNCNCPYMKGVCMHLYRSKRHIIIPFIWGILVGIAFTTLVFQQRVLMESQIPFDESKLTFVQGLKVTFSNLDRRKYYRKKNPPLLVKATFSNTKQIQSEKIFSTDLVCYRSFQIYLNMINS